MNITHKVALILFIFQINNLYSQEFIISKTDHVAYEVRDLNKVGDFFLNIFKFKEIEIDNPSLRWFDIGDGFEIHLGENKEANHKKIKANHLAVTVNSLEIFTPNPKDCKKYSDDFSKLPDRGRVYGRGHFDFYRDIIDDFKGKKFPITYSDCLSSINILSAHYASHETGKEIKIDKNKIIKSKNLGKKNKKISDLYRIK